MKKILYIILLVTLLAPQTLMAEGVTTQRVLRGDVNADGRIDVGDLTALVSFILNTDTSHFVRAAADMNNDDAVNVTDYTLLVNKILSGDTDTETEYIEITVGGNGTFS